MKINKNFIKAGIIATAIASSFVIGRCSYEGRKNASDFVQPESVRPLEFVYSDIDGDGFCDTVLNKNSTRVLFYDSRLEDQVRSTYGISFRSKELTEDMIKSVQRIYSGNKEFATQIYK